ncbi:hypothetical protein [Rudaea cellulosilytica]|uniref:hypothetical protein n=1 Tax=Rudaea cellulosilytica TaxID=540746 RepID=UPI00035FFAAB|nr:hypothetical protein [Rudaea cellulosilytica]
MRYLPALLCALLLTGVAAPAVQATPRFPPGAIWNQDISSQAADPNSAKMIAASIGWGTGTTQFQLDFSMHTLYTAGQATTSTALVKEPGYYLPDCDTGVSVPLPATGAIEGSSNYSCDIANNDCHLFVVDGNTLYESYQTTVDTAGLHSLCLVKWRLDLVYPQNGRGDGCTSADAAGFPMAPLIFGPDEVYAAMQTNGDLGHAIRFILPNSRMRRGAYVYPASHNGAPNSSSPDAIPYGAHLRLQPGFNISAYNPAAQVILRTLKKYGMFLSDGGSVPLTADDGMFSTHQWTDLGIDSHSLFGVALSNFEVMPLGTVVAYDNSSAAAECVRNNFGATVLPRFPARILDTRAAFTTSDGLFAGGGARGAGSTLDLLVAGRGGVPASGATAVMLNLTATNTTALSFVTAWPTGTNWPLASNLNFTAGQTVPNLALAGLGNGGMVSLFNFAGTTDLIADTAWYFDAASKVAALVPARILDTRPGFTTIDGQFAGSGGLGSGQKLDLKVTGRGGVPASGVAGVVMNVTVTAPASIGYITVWPSGQVQPLASNLNFAPAQTVPNLVVTGVGTNGEVSLFSGGSTQLIADVVGWFPSDAQLISLTPARLLDTRAGGGTLDGKFSGIGAMGAQAMLDLDVSGRGGVPANAAAVVLNVTAVSPSAVGYITAWPSGFSRPNASNLNVAPGQTRPNLVISAIGSNGKVSLFNSAGTTDIVVDVLGWLAPGS